MDPGGGGFGTPSVPNEQSQDQPPQPPAGATGQSGTDPDSWCAISSSPRSASTSSFADAAPSSPIPDMESDLWQVAGAGESSGHVEAGRLAHEAGGAEVMVPWCNDDQHDHERTSVLQGNLGSSTSSLVPMFPGVEGPNMCQIRGVDLEACEGPSDYRQLQSLGRQESLELLAAEWAQLVQPEQENSEIYSHDELRHFQDDLENFLFGSEAILPPDIHPYLGGGGSNPETPNDSEPLTSTSSVSIGETEVEIRDYTDPAVMTSSSGSIESTPLIQPHGKRKWPEGQDAAAAATSGDAHDCGALRSTPHQQSSNDTLQPEKGKGVRQPSPQGRTRPRYAIQTRTEVDVIDDGYRWRKYGQKPVKNSAHPRNYYRCTTANCPVRKRVERSTENPSHVLTTYDGTHTHPENSPRSDPALHAAANSHPHPPPEDAPPSPASLRGLPRPLPPSNYITPNILAHLFSAGSLPDPTPRWSHPPQGGSFMQRNIELLRVHHLFRLQYQTQYPLLSNMLNLMRANFQPRARPPLLDPRVEPRLDPRMDPRLDARLDPISALLAAQGYAMRTSSGQNQGDQALGVGSNSGDQQASTGAGAASPPVTRNQQRLFWMRELMGETTRLGSDQQAPWSTQGGPQQASDSAVESDQGPDQSNFVDLGDPA